LYLFQIILADLNSTPQPPSLTREEGEGDELFYLFAKNTFNRQTNINKFYYYKNYFGQI